MVSQGLPWWASRREGMVRDAKGGPTVPQRNRLIVDNKLPISSMPINTMFTMRFVEYMFFFVKVNLILALNFHTLGNTDWCETLRHKSPVIATSCCDDKTDGFV